MKETKTSNDNRLLVRVSEAARLLDVSPGHVYNMLNSGMLLSIRLGRSVRIPRVYLEQMIEERMKEWEGHDSRSLSEKY